MISERLKLARGLSGLSQKALGRLANLSPSHVQLIEAGERKRLEATTVARIAKVLGVSAEWLLSGTGKAPTAASIKRAVEASCQS